MNSLKPKKRSKLRIFIGKKVYRLKRYSEWYIDGKKYATKRLDEKLAHVVFKHRTPLLRVLKDVDMELQTNKITNLKIAAKQLNGVVLQPGETFSYWRLIGSTTKRKGYVDGMILHYGQVTTGVGGGLCQLSNLIYWMTLHAPLTVTERYRHSYDVFPDSKRSQPFGSGATCAYNYLDLQIKNETVESYQLIIYLTDTSLVGEWRAANPANRTYKVYEKDHSFTRELWGGYVRHNSIFREVYNLNDDFIDDEFITGNHAITMYEPFLTYEE
ncbi:VanW family protein [Sporosarcina limicola]|uniref:Vancomycin resistance protein VanW n=1 Tax=Sporosarcina limicola TaxID=34101 RepID=A0A927MEE9_9BACL|nr:VanW family protein [Sporosarcina limicola]MBE1553040.1 vancomycin resistance protein VanW [Sporosarcina limicola]